MPADQSRNLPHIYLPNHGENEEFTSPRSGGGSATAPPRDRNQHASVLERALVQALAGADALRSARDERIAGGTPGFYLEFELPKAQAAVVDKLEYRGRRAQIELVAVRPLPEQEDRVAATVFVPDIMREYYLKKIETYRTKETRTGKPKNEPLVASLETVRLAAVRSLYTDAPELFPAAGRPSWWEWSSP